MPLIPLYKKQRSGSPNWCGKHDSTSWDPNQDSSGPNDTITEKHNRSGSKKIITEYVAKDAPAVVSWYPKHDSSGSNATITDEHDRSDSDPMITEYTAKEAPGIVALDVNSNNIRSQGNRQSTDTNDENKVEVGNKTELICARVTLLLKFPSSNNNRNATKNLLKDFPVQIQHSNMHVVLLPWYSSNNNSSTLPIEQPGDVSKDFKALKTYSSLMNPKQNKKQQLVYSSIFLCHSDNSTQIQKDTSFWFENDIQKLYKTPLQWENTTEVPWL